MHRLQQIYIFLLNFVSCLCLSVTFIAAQSPIQDSLPPLDSVPTLPDTIIPTDSTQLQVSVSPNTPDDDVVYSCQDSIHIDVKQQKVYLYGQAKVTYQTLNLTSGKIVIDFQHKEVTAEPLIDSLGQPIQLPDFNDRDQNFIAKKIIYNYESKKGIVYQAFTQQGEVYVHGTKTKYIGKDEKAGRENDIIFNKNALITTCDHPKPHFGILSSKQKVIPNKLVVIGPSNLQIANVPTPLVLPFGFFPITKGRTAGLIFPDNYEFSERLGFGLQQIGYYTPLGEKADLQVTGDIYLRGSWRFNIKPRYKKRYKYSGSFEFEYANLRLDVPNSADPASQQSIKLFWTHRQEAKAHPYNSLSGSINIQTNNFQQLNNNAVQQQQENTLRSNMSFRRTFPNSPFVLNAAISHSQNTRTRSVTVNLPELNLNMNRIYPFKRKNKVGSKELFYENITFDYDTRIFNQFSATDTTLFTQETLDEAQYGVTHNLSSDLKFNLLSYFRFNTRAELRENWYFKEATQTFDPTWIIDTLSIDTINGEQVITIDTTFGQVIEEINGSFVPVHQYSFSADVNTQLFGLMQFKKGWLRGIRHLAKPSVGFSFEPDYTKESLGYFGIVQTTNEPGNSDEPDTYSRLPTVSGLSRPSTTGRRMNLNYSLTNNFEAKVFSKRDSSFKKFNILKTLSFNGNYNFAADSLHFSTLNYSGTTPFLKGLTNFAFNGSFDPYQLNDEGKRIDKFYWENPGEFLRFSNINLRFVSNFGLQKARTLFSKKKDGEPKSAELPDDDLSRIIKGMNINHVLSLNWQASKINGQDTVIHTLTHSLSLRIQSIALTKNWSVQIGGIGYNFINKNITYPDITFSRDLHCWQMGLHWFPQIGAYNFFIKVKPGPLEFLEIPYNKNQFDGFGNF